jgi:hypothetical protein
LLSAEQQRRRAESLQGQLNTPDHVLQDLGANLAVVGIGRSSCVQFALLRVVLHALTQDAIRFTALLERGIIEVPAPS